MIKFLVGISVSATMLGASLPAFAEESEEIAVVETVESESAAEEEAQEAVEEAVEETELLEEETETETEDDFVEGSALLSDYDYVAGSLDENGWISVFFNMKFEPSDGITMAVEDNQKLVDEYYHRHGEDKIVGNSELVAKDASNGYVQLSVIANPNAEDAKDILDRFTKVEELELLSKTKDLTIGGKVFTSCTGVFDKQKYMVGVCTDVENMALAIKVKYKDTSARKDMLACFAELEVEEETELAPEEASEAEPVEETQATEESEAAVDKSVDETEISEVPEVIVPSADDSVPETEIFMTPEAFEDAQLIDETEA